MRALQRLAMRMVPRRAHLALAHYFYSRPGGGEPEIQFVSKFADPARDAVDIGANIGLYTYRLSPHVRTVHAFEPNPRLFEVLAAAKLRNAALHRVALSSIQGHATFYVPRAAYGELLGWGSLVQGRCPSAQSEEAIDVEVAPLDRFGLTNVSFMKIDVEGHELQVLEGAAETLSQNRPAIVIESDMANRPQVDAVLRRHGLQRRTLEELFGQRGSDANLLYMPS
jgi:FkbM family methyltransferase